MALVDMLTGHGARSADLRIDRGRNPIQNMLKGICNTCDAVHAAAFVIGYIMCSLTALSSSLVGPRRYPAGELSGNFPNLRQPRYRMSDIVSYRGNCFITASYI